MSSWKGKTRGGLAGYRIFVFLINTFGLGVAYTVLRFVALYFFVFAPKATKSSYSFFRTRIGYSRLKSLSSVYQNFVVFGKTLIDKVAIASGKKGQFRYKFDGEENLLKLANEGGFLYSAHLGNWEVAGQLLDERISRTNVLMHAVEHEKIKAFLDGVKSEQKLHIIPMKEDMSHLFAIKNALEEKEFICLHGDRFLEGSRTVQVDFLGAKAHFPVGPFALASTLKSNYVFTFAFRGKGKTYNLCSTEIFTANKKPQEIVIEYARHLERKVLENPLQWFNYYDFWSTKAPGGTHRS